MDSVGSTQGLMNTLMKIYIIKVKFALEKAMKAEEE